MKPWTYAIIVAIREGRVKTFLYPKALVKEETRVLIYCDWTILETHRFRTLGQAETWLVGRIFEEGKLPRMA